MERNIWRRNAREEEEEKHWEEGIGQEWVLRCWWSSPVLVLLAVVLGQVLVVLGSVCRTGLEKIRWIAAVLSWVRVQAR